MKKCIFVLVLLGIMPVLGANAYEYRSSSSEYTTTRSSDSGNYKKTTKIRRSGGYSNTITNNFIMDNLLNIAIVVRRIVIITKVLLKKVKNLWFKQEQYVLHKNVNISWHIRFFSHWKEDLVL